METTKYYTTIDAKGWLKRGRHIFREIEDINAKKLLSESACTTITRRLEKRIARGSPSRGDTALISHATRTATMDADLADLERKLDEMYDIVRDVDGWEHRTVLIEHHVFGRFLYDIAVDFGKTPQWVTGIHKEALERLQIILEGLEWTE